METISLKFEIGGKGYYRVVPILDKFELYGFTWCIHQLYNVSGIIDDTFSVSELETGCGCGRLASWFDSIEEAKEEVTKRLNQRTKGEVMNAIATMKRYIENHTFEIVEP